MTNRILIVDDDKNTLLSYRRLLHNSFEVVIAKSGVEGTSLLKEQGPFAVVVSDYRMPDMNGVKFLAEARQIGTVNIVSQFEFHRLVVYPF